MYNSVGCGCSIVHAIAIHNFMTLNDTLYFSDEGQSWWINLGGGCISIICQAPGIAILIGPLYLHLI